MKNLLSLSLASLCIFAHHSSAYITVNLPGNTEFSGWESLTSANNPGFPGFNSGVLWPSPISPNVTGSATTAGLNKVSGVGNPGGSSIYTFVTPSTFSLSSTSPLASLQTLIFQIDMGNGTGGIFMDTEPKLSLNGGGQDFIANYTATANGAFAFTDFTTGQPGFTTILAYQWDLSSFVAPITSFSITWTGHGHSQIYAAQLHSGNTVSQVIPEPTSGLLIGLAGLMLALKRNRRPVQLPSR